MLKITDKEGDNVTITSRHDIQSQLSDIIMQYQRQMQSASAPKLGQTLPPMRVQVVKVAAEVRAGVCAEMWVGRSVDGKCGPVV